MSCEKLTVIGYAIPTVPPLCGYTETETPWAGFGRGHDEMPTLSGPAMAGVVETDGVGVTVGVAVGLGVADGVMLGVTVGVGVGVGVE